MKQKLFYIIAGIDRLAESMVKNFGDSNIIIKMLVFQIN